MDLRRSVVPDPVPWCQIQHDPSRSVVPDLNFLSRSKPVLLNSASAALHERVHPLIDNIIEVVQGFSAGVIDQTQSLTAVLEPIAW